MAEDRWLVVGLGNPGPAYAGNRHNAGFMVADLLAARMGGKFKAKRGLADILEGRLAGNRVALMKPRSYVNESGGPVTSMRDFFKVPVERILVIHDELDIPYGTLRLRIGGGEGGHNGIRSLVSSLRSKDFHRLRFGVGRPPGRMDPADFVLKDFTPAERRELGVHLVRAADAVESLLADGLERAQNVFHTDVPA